MTKLEDIKSFFMSLQDEICQGLENLDGSARFMEDPWERKEGGGGRTRVIMDGKVFEKGGVNFSHVHGPLPETISSKLNLKAGSHFHATGVSIVIHPNNPHVPIIHMNVRYFEIEDGTWWFGGGIDVTPTYVIREEAVQVHQYLKNTCDQHDPAYYPEFKAWCDRYFYIKHRKETRGIGGLFFDRLKADSAEGKDARWHFVQAVGKSFLPIYAQLVNANKKRMYSTREKDFQMLRRSRYVEFNLVYDRGTKFGLETDGRIESILMSMPPETKWFYNFQPEPGSYEEDTLRNLTAQDWLGLESVEN